MENTNHVFFTLKDNILFHFMSFRGTDILPKYMEKRRFFVYGLQAFGVPLLMMICIVSYDRHVYNNILQGGERSSDRHDPGFGEETCWFSSCSKALSLFLYGYV